ncbi:RNA polymerase sigma factor [Micromonospora sp. NPDC000207]|uniref:RNA polymerase sigma factor n=1 Tax=Micromonospora sp. NPDC000207 TaxID=3154246 RepID=UPI0033167DD4
MTGDLTEAALAAQGGDEEAFRLLYRSLQPGLLRYLTVLVGTDAEDVASETWLQVARDLPTFSGGEFRAWAVTIARNRAMDHLRRERRRPALPVPVHAFADLPGDTDTELEVGEIFGTDRAMALISTLPPAEAEAVLLRAVVGLDAQSAGRVLGRRPGAVRTAAHRGLRRLAALLGQLDPDAPPADARGVVPDPRPGSGSRSRAPHAEPADG